MRVVNLTGDTFTLPSRWKVKPGENTIPEEICDVPANDRFLQKLKQNRIVEFADEYVVEAPRPRIKSIADMTRVKIVQMNIDQLRDLALFLHLPNDQVSNDIDELRINVAEAIFGH